MASSAFSKAKGAVSKGRKPSKLGVEQKREETLQAVVIVDTFQTRFRPFTLEQPRCLLPLANTPLIDYTLEFLDMNGVQEVFIYAAAHHQQIQDYIGASHWTEDGPFTRLEFIRVSDAHSIGDFLRDLDKRDVIDGDFILVHGDLVSNIALDGALAAHKARKQANRDSIMTMVLREGGEADHHTKIRGTRPVFALDPQKKRCLQYEETNPRHQDHYAILDPDLLNECCEIEVRTDLIDPQIDICTPDVLALWSESFDYELPRANFLHGALKDYELNGKMIHTEFVSRGYCARADNLAMLAAISQDVLYGWAYPFGPDFNLLDDQTYQRYGNGLYKEDGVRVPGNCYVHAAVIGMNTTMGSNCVILNSTIGRNCKIGSKVQILHSHIWDNVTIEDGAFINHAILADKVVVKERSSIGLSSLLASGVIIDSHTTVPAFSVLSLVSPGLTALTTDSSLVGLEGRGARYLDPELDDLDDISRLQQSLVYSAQDFAIDASSVSSLGDEDGLSETESEASHPAGEAANRSRLSSVASEDSVGFANFVSEAAQGLSEALRSLSGDFSSEKLEFMSLRLANNASDDAVRRAIATAFVGRAVELMGVENGNVNAKTAASRVLKERDGATTFIQEVGVGGGKISEQVEFAIAVQKACAHKARAIDISRAGDLCVAMFQNLWNEDILEEDAILRCLVDKRGRENEAMIGVQDKLKGLAEFFDNLDSDESEEEEDDEDDDE